MSAGTGSSISVSRDTLARFFGKNKLFVEKACTHDVVSNPDSRTCTECNESPGEWNAKLGGIRLSLLCVHCERGKTDGTSLVSLERSQPVQVRFLLRSVDAGGWGMKSIGNCQLECSSR
jgi:hypothetical protein